MFLRQQNNFISETLRLWLCRAAVCLCIFFIFTFLFQNKSEEEHKKQIFSYRPSSPRVELDGLDYNLSYGGETKFDIKADKFLIRKKKMGLIRFALAQEALLENADIAVFGVPGSTAENQAVNQNPLVFAGVPLKLFYSKRISALVMKPVRVKFYDTAKGVSQLTAMKASFCLKERSVLFKGNVEISSGSNVLKTSQLTLFPKEAKIQVNKKFTLIVNEKEKTGRHLVADIFLKSISF